MLGKILSNQLSRHPAQTNITTRDEVTLMVYPRIIFKTFYVFNQPDLTGILNCFMRLIPMYSYVNRTKTHDDLKKVVLNPHL